MDNGIVGYRHTARKVQMSDFADFDYIMAMDRENLSNLKRLEQQALKSNVISGDIERKVMLFGDFGEAKGRRWSTRTMEPGMVLTLRMSR